MVELTISAVNNDAVAANVTVEIYTEDGSALCKLSDLVRISIQKCCSDIYQSAILACRTFATHKRRGCTFVAQSLIVEVGES